jgi:hypothetical protein
MDTGVEELMGVWLAVEDYLSKQIRLTSISLCHYLVRTGTTIYLPNSILLFPTSASI